MKENETYGSEKIPVIKKIDSLKELEILLGEFLYEFDCSTPNEFKTRRTSRDKSNYSYFRGHSKTSYKLASTLERYLMSIFGEDYVRCNFTKIQEEYLKKCKRVLVQQSIDGYYSLPTCLTDDDIWAFGRHYQLKTPILDWSRSFFVALYFAFEELEPEQEEYRVIYRLSPLIHSEYEIIIEPTIKIGSRINAQNGVFTKLLSFELEELNAKFRTGFFNENNPIIGKYLISSKLRIDVLDFLASINIDAYTIYPDLLGKIKACEVGIDDAIAEINLDNQNEVDNQIP